MQQHLATQVHKTIAHLRESSVSVELSELHAQINPKFSNVSILHKSSDFCLASKIDISLLSRNIMGNLGQHVKGSSNLQNAWKGAISARDIAFFVPVTKISNLTDATKWSDASNVPVKQRCQGFYLNKYVYSVNNETVSVDPKLLVNDLNPDKDDSKITWYPEPHFSFMKPGEDSEGTIKGPFRSVSWSRSADV